MVIKVWCKQSERNGHQMESIVRGVEHDYEQICEVIGSLRGLYPFLKVSAIGKSVLGRKIFACEFCDRKNADSAPAVLFAGAFHGTERLTTLVLLRFIEQFCAAMNTNTSVAGMDTHRALCGRRLIIVPLANPDGCEIALRGSAGAGSMAGLVKRLSGGDFSSWNANARGVDINHNFNAGWEILHQMERDAGIYGPGPRQYGGPAPESEPETLALTKLCREQHIAQALAFHSQGEEIYWYYSENTPDRGKKLARIFAASSCYALEEPVGLASHGGFKDWFIEEFGRPGFTIEIGRGKNPLSPALLNPIYEKIEEMMMIAAAI